MDETVACPDSQYESKRSKLSQAMSKSVSLNVDRSENPLTLTPDYSKLPELNTDKDIDDVLCKISELLTSNSIVSSATELNDSRSIEAILKEAEDIVRDSSSYFDDEEILKSSRIDGCNVDALSDRTECSVELEQEQSRHMSFSSVKNEEIIKENGIDEHMRVESLENKKITAETKTEADNQVLADKPLSLKDLEVPDRPTNLDLPLDVVHVEHKKVSQTSTNCPNSFAEHLSLENHIGHSNLSQDSIVNHCQIYKPSLNGGSKSSEENTVITQSKSAAVPIKHVDRKSNGVANHTPSEKTLIPVKTKEDSARKDPSIAKEGKLMQLGIISCDPARKSQIPSVHNHHPKTVPNSKVNMEDFKKVYEEKISSLEQQIRILSSKLIELEKHEQKEQSKSESEMARLQFLEKEVKSQEELIAGYQKENKRLLGDTAKARKVWLEAEKRLTEKVQRLERDLKRANDLNITEALELKEALADARDEINRLEEQSIELKNEKRGLEKQSNDLKDEMKRLRCESDGYRAELEELRVKDRERDRRVAADHSLAAATLQGKLSQANNELARKQTEVIRLNTEMTRLRGELERARLGSVVTGETHAAHSTSHQVRQLEIALERERDNSRRTLAQLDSINKHNLDLARQVKELETIVKRRSKCGGGISWGEDGQVDMHKVRETLEIKTRKLEQELASKEKQLSEHQAKLSDLQNKYEKEVSNLQEKVRESNRRSSSVASSRSNPRNPTQNANSDAQLLATIRGLKAEIATKDKQMTKLSRELDDTKKKMTRSQSQQSNTNRPTPLNNNRPNSNVGSKISETSSSGGASTLESGNSSKNYNPFLFEEDRETILFLRNENSNLHEEVKRLEQDLINLHNKRIQDLSELESNHSAEVKRALREQTARQANSQITHMRGQLYTQQMVINHLKNQIKVYEQKNQDVTLLKAERDQLEQSLVEANKKVATLHQLSSPDSNDYHNLLEKLEWLERRHELREAKLQTIVKELVARQQKSNVCSSATCKDKLYNKNREICYYRAEIDKILDSLTEFKYIK